MNPKQLCSLPLPLHPHYLLPLQGNKAHMHTHKLPPNRTFSTCSQGAIWKNIPFSKEQEYHPLGRPCPFNLSLGLWLWAKAYVLNNRSVRKHMLSNSAAQLGMKSRALLCLLLETQRNWPSQLQMGCVQLVSMWIGCSAWSTFRRHDRWLFTELQHMHQMSLSLFHQ